LEDVRRSVLDLRAAPLEGLPLAEALRRLVMEFAAEQHVEAAFEARGVDRPLAPRVEVGVFRVAQEALTNVAVHAAARAVAVRLFADEPQGGRLRLVVEDDGRGF